MVKSTGDWAWDYFSQTYPMSGSLIKENCELKVMRLRELNEIAGFDLDWEVVEFTETEYRDLSKEQHQKDEKLGRNPLLYYHYNSSVQMKKIKKGCICKHRKAVQEIYKKYKNGMLVKKQVA